MWEAPAGTAGSQLETGGHAHSASSHGDSAEVTLTCTHVLALGGSAPLGDSRQIGLWKHQFVQVLAGQLICKQSKEDVYRDHFHWP